MEAKNMTLFDYDVEDLLNTERNINKKYEYIKNDEHLYKYLNDLVHLIKSNSENKPITIKYKKALNEIHDSDIEKAQKIKYVDAFSDVIIYHAYKNYKLTGTVNHNSYIRKLELFTDEVIKSLSKQPIKLIK